MRPKLKVLNKFASRHDSGASILLKLHKQLIFFKQRTRMTRLKEWREKYLLTADAILAITLVAGVIGGLSIWIPLSDFPVVLDGSRDAVYASLASIAGSLLGFILTAVLIISVFGTLPRFRLLKQSAQHHAIFRVFFDTIYWLAGGTIAGLLGLVLDKDGKPNYWVTLAVLVIFVVVASRVWRCVWILQQITKIAATPLHGTQPSEPPGQ